MKKGSKIFVLILLVFFVLIALTLVIKRNQNIGPRPGEVPSDEGPVLVDGWILPENNNYNPVWGIVDGIAFGVQESGKPPRMDNAPGGTWAPGLIYVMFTDEKGETYFFNYLGFSVLGEKGLDQSEAEKIVFTPVSEKVKEGVLTVVFETSNFDKYNFPLEITLTVDKSRPREIGISTRAIGSANYVHVSATAGNLGRIRNLYLKEETINAKDLYSGEEPGQGCFYPIKLFSLDRLKVDSSGVIVYAGNDENGWVGEWGSDVAPYYNKPKFYQYWRKYSGSYNSDLKVTVNGRDSYFSGFVNPCNGKKVSGGVAYENFDMIEKYYDDQKFWFGYSYDLSA